MPEQENPTKNEFEISQKENMYFSVSTFKFILMSISTLGIYQIYWGYKNWRYLKSSKSLKIMPFWRAIFAPIWVFSLFNYIYESAREYGIKTQIPSTPLAGICFVFYIFSNLPDPYWLLTNLTIIPLLLVNSTITKVNEKNKSFKQNSDIKNWQWTLAALGILLNFLISYITFVDFDVEEFTFQYTLERDLIKKCDKEKECIIAVENQVKPCMEKSNWRNLIKYPDSNSENQRFIAEFYACITDKDGNPYFETN